MSLNMICRKTEVLKLSHGEYVQLVPIEISTILSDFVDFACVVANTQMQYLIGILCLNVVNVRRLARSLNHSDDEDFESLVNDSGLQHSVKADIESILDKNPLLNKYQRPLKYVFTTDQWTPESKLLTPSFKIIRSAIVEKYKEILSSC
ncbi:Long-chain-fatty-acid--CoA ligase 3 [Thelohanellus kitauei]|uniref:Long-chain-fatty-acid--CoA ligase 3 n=1 Tax=Thelohanellus kitauei TaxID=669202 RepID=A0A0C2JAN4_THEKT|nr:Long-chain-fatty-acid--CoA ligase 3 [Thelohanellus kitauei]